jgi:hypothetical protein
VSLPEKSSENVSGTEFSPDVCTKDSAGALLGGLASAACMRSGCKEEGRRRISAFNCAPTLE